MEMKLEPDFKPLFLDPLNCVALEKLIFLNLTFPTCKIEISIGSAL